MNVSFFQELLTSISESGRAWLDRASGGVAIETIEDLSHALLTGRGEASGVALAREILNRYKSLPEEEKTNFFLFLASTFGPDEEKVQSAAARYVEEPGPETLRALSNATTSARQEFFRRLNLAPGATAAIVHMREDLFTRLKDYPELRLLDEDIVHLFTSWFNRGFLVLKHIDWDAPASILEKIIQYEAVHEIKGWSDLRRRLEPSDRRCFGFFHPSLVDEPLIFVEVALTHAIPKSIQKLLAEEPSANGTAAPATTAVFYSISNCQLGLRGISFGNFLIKQVVEDLAKEIPSLKTFVTLSPVPGFRRWINKQLADPQTPLFDDGARDIIASLDSEDWFEDEEFAERVKAVLMPLAAEYFLNRKREKTGTALDPVAHFHLRNGARLENINWLGDTSPKGLNEAYGIMVNYLYELKHIERNHELYENEGEIAASKTVRGLLPASEKSTPSLLMIEKIS